MSIFFTRENPAAPAGREIAQPNADAATSSLNFTIPKSLVPRGITVDGGGTVPTTGFKGFIDIPYPGTIVGWTLIGDVSGSAEFDILKGTPSNDTNMPSRTSIVALAPPSLVAQQRKHSTTLTGWTLGLLENDVLEIRLASATTCTWLMLQIIILRS